MGTFTWPLRISGMDGPKTLDLEATVDAGAFYTTIPARLLRELGIEPMGSRWFLVADGRRVEMEYGRAWATMAAPAPASDLSDIDHAPSESSPSTASAITVEAALASRSIDSLERTTTSHASG